MLKLLLYGILCVLCVTASIAKPVIECDAPKHDFGTQISGGMITNRFILENAGDESLEIVEVKSCCGVKSKVDPMTILPGSNAVCTSVFNTKKRYGEQDKQILLITNDKKNLYYDLRMTGTLLKPIEFEPRFIRFENLLPDSSISKDITATNLLEIAVMLESVSTTVSGLTARVVESNERSWKIQMESDGSLPVGRINGNVKLEFSTGTVSVPIIGTINPLILITPDRIQIGSASSGTIERQVMLRSGDGRDFKVHSVELRNAGGTVKHAKVASGKWQCRVSLDSDAIKANASLRISTSLDPKTPIEVLISTPGE